MAINGNATSAWKLPGIAYQAASQTSGITIAAWARWPATPAAEATIVAWAGAQFVHLAINAEVGPGCNLLDVDNAFTTSNNGVGNTFGAWQPFVLSKQSQSSRTLYAGSRANAVTDTTALAAQTLTDFYFGGAESSGTPMQAVGAVGEVAAWQCVLGPAEIDRYMQGESALGIRRESLIVYVPARDDLVNYTSIVVPVQGLKPTFVEHPKVQDFRLLLRRPTVVAMFGRRNPPQPP